jgi:hypothetical protein
LFCHLALYLRALAYLASDCHFTSFQIRPPSDAVYMPVVIAATDCFEHQVRCLTLIFDQASTAVYLHVVEVTLWLQSRLAKFAQSFFA